MGGLCPLDTELYSFPASSGNVGGKQEMTEEKIEK